ILYDRQALLLIEIDGQTQHRTDEAALSLMGCHKALRRKHVLTAFINIDELKSGKANGYEVLYLPYCYSMDDGVVEALKEFVRNGGTLWADGLVGWKNEYGDIRPSLPGGLSEVFGLETYVADVDPVEEAYSVTEAAEKGGELWKIPLQLHGAQVVIRDREGRPFATEHAYGKGRAIYYGAAVSLAYFRRDNPQVLEWIVSPALKASSSSLVQLVRASGQVGFRSLHHSSGPLAILTNWDQDSEIQVRFGGQYETITDLVSNSQVKVTRRGQYTYTELTLRAGNACVVKANQ
ncbi:MAG: beta-galactosidase trimerization domain-containing protein, partial [Candidatus Micrarchaeaceae archaeon]